MKFVFQGWREFKKISDGLFGECSDGLVPVLTYFNDLDPIEIELLNDQLLQLKTSGNDWKSSKTQCVLIYFKLAVIFQLKYDEDFCEVHNPANIWQLLQIVKSSFSSKDFQRVGDYIENSAEKLPDNELLESYVEEVASEEPQTANDDPQEIIENTEGNQASPSTTDDIDRISDYMNDDNVDEEMSRSIDVPEINNDEQLKQFIKKFLMRTEDANSVGEEEEMVPLNVNDDEEPPLKKDIEHLGNPNIGLENTEHKIVKGSGPFQKVEANRVYLKISDDLNDEQFYRLIQYLNQIIAKPKNLIFSDFAINDDQLSFEVSRSFSGHPRSLKRLDAIADVAEAVYKRRKDIESLSGVHVDETGIGSGQDSVPLENNNRDDLFIPILTICALTILVLITVMAVHQFRQMQRNRNATQISKLAEQIESKTSSTYQVYFLFFVFSYFSKKYFFNEIYCLKINSLIKKFSYLNCE
ncbi:unnamed protein product [Dracunculus medinensis]|uniref:Death domain-containing protein n=1 Tax=Dracunculus medinensis TaxID=318479 RepID=A0A0N4UGF2_DRAME|nr:unnamed protein product [Dracunculus medinensis]